MLLTTLRTILTPVLFVAVALDVSAQTAECPQVNVSCPDAVSQGQPLTCSATVNDGDPAVTYAFKWTVSAGSISSGQDTSSITVDIVGLGNQTLTVTVEVGRMPEACGNTASFTTPPLPSTAGCALPFDEYGDIQLEDEMARLDNFSIQLQNAPTAQGYIIVYGGRVGRAGEAQRRAERAKNYVVNERGIEAARVITIDGGYREELTFVFWLAPSGAEPPAASPTVDPSEVQIVADKPKPRRRPKRAKP